MQFFATSDYLTGQKVQQIFKLNRAIKDSQLAFWPFSILLLNIDNLYHKYMDRGASWQLDKFWYLNNI